MKCNKCGTEFEGKFCPECGTPAEEEKIEPVPVEEPEKKSIKEDPIGYIKEICQKCIDWMNKFDPPLYKRKWLVIVTVIVVFGLFSSCVSSCKGTNNTTFKTNSFSTKKSTFDWDDIKLKDLLPKPETNYGEVYTNEEDILWLQLDDCDDEMYEDYMNACIEKGYTIDSEKSSSTYTAFNAEGYSLRLSNYSYSDELNISLDAPIEMGDITWPTGIAGQLLPVPKSLKGKFITEHDTYFSLYIGDTPKADYDAYVSSCAEKGFTVNYSKDEKYYYAYNEQGYYLTVKYEGNNIMYISIKEPEETDEADEADEANEANEETEQSILNTSPDKYTAYVNNYIGMNAANVGYTSFGGDRRDYLGNTNVELIFVTSDGTYVGADNEEELKNWKIVSQNPAPNTEVKMTYKVNSLGEEYNSLTDWVSLDKIELGVIPVNSNESGPELTEVTIPTDKYTAYVRNYVGRNLDSVGYVSMLGDYRDAYGDTTVELVIATDDGSYFELTGKQDDEGNNDYSFLQNYVITGQNVPVNTAITMTFATDSDGNEYSWTNYQSVESITLTVHAIN